MLSISVWPTWIDRLDLLVATLVGLLIGTWLVVRRRRRIGVGPAPDRATSYSRVLRRQRFVVVLLVLVWFVCLAARLIGTGIVLTSPDVRTTELAVRGIDALLLAVPLAPLVLQLGALATQTTALPTTPAADRASWRAAAASGQITPTFWAVVLTFVLWVVSLVVVAITLGGPCRTDGPCVSVTTPVVSHVAVVSAATLGGALVVFLAMLIALRRALGAHGTETDDATIIRAATAGVITRSTTDAILLALGTATVLVGTAASSGFEFSWGVPGAFGWTWTGPEATPGEPMPSAANGDIPHIGAPTLGLVVFGSIVRGVGAAFVAWAWARILLHTVRR
ncbi:hypothetical protein F8O01_13745 [Pseudoclavibacter chungangensis]|uniref:Uncharacterized protein n=1 Tax=Pseudoclavibacter chungangensis TaxID=587635 RepID=A0A7J5BP34_9MICO|nr:hypothetical protein [Pseudoclavibacter chungangensis]KAB1654294.1 hypothetical protein F8O01_13745 [Pseudoclavibacter chungangensis]NYJ65300.1 hypothetical protein [Pseudoclavibacter chungangensis]